MIGTENFAGGVGGAAGELFGFGEFVLAGEGSGEVIASIQSFDVIGAAEFLGDAQDFAILGFGSGELALIKQGVSKAAMASHGECVLGA